MGRVRPGERGAAAVEFALVVPLILVLVFGIIAYAYMFSFRQALSQAAAEGARAAVGASTTGCSTSAASWNVTACAPGTAAAAAVGSDLNQYSNGGTALACGAASLTCTIAKAASCAGGHTCISVTVSYPYRDNPLLPTVPGFGFTLPSTLSFTSVVEVS